MYKAINCTFISLIPKTDNAKYIKDYRSISVCTIMHKVISKVMTRRMSKVLGSIINNCQSAFVPRQQIRNHILLAYELLKGYSRKGDTPRYTMQLDLHKAYDMVDWPALKRIL
ncbi:unnamed protein product [Vicia faba]|uniref:Reverse transcriptase domain-containing protein n=1 Tax=Vicia faba TaxID=3906 RepID=A0AAV0YQH1_VICFA|nr:unnamed protein product [Vicia faba]